MPDAGPPTLDPGRPDGDEQQPAAAPARPSMFDDPLVRRMTFVAAGLVIVFLATVVGALVTGLLLPSGPRTLTEKEIAVAGEAVRAGSTDPEVWGTYIAALVDGGQYGRARSVIEDARRSIDDSGTAEIPLGEARLYSAQGQYERAIESVDEVKRILEADLETRLASGGRIREAALLDGLHPNYDIAALLKAYALVELGRHEDAVDEFTIFLERNRGASDVLVDRGNANREAGDTAAAEADYREAMRFIPDMPQAVEGLESIGVTP